MRCEGSKLFLGLRPDARFFIPIASWPARLRVVGKGGFRTFWGFAAGDDPVTDAFSESDSDRDAA